MSTYLDYRYVPRVDQDDLPGFETLDEPIHLLDPIDAIPLIDRVAAANYARLSFEHRLFAHRKQVAEVARLVLSQGFNLEEGGESNGRLLGPLDVELEGLVGSRWGLRSMLRAAAATGDLEAASTRVSVTPATGWLVHLAHNYRQAPDVQYITGGVNTSWFDQRLRLGYNIRFDGLNGVIREHGMSLQYLAQCWQVEATMRVRNTENTPFFSSTIFTIQFNLFHF
jgi:hypothetical protein